MLLQIGGILLVGYSLKLYEGVETFYRLYAIIILIYFFLFFSYLILRSIKKKGIVSFIIPVMLILVVLFADGYVYYYLTKVYKAIDAFSENENEYHTSLVSYNKDLKSEKDLKNMKIGIVKDKTDIEGNILPLKAIDELKLKTDNEIKEFDSTLELLYALKEKEIDAAFFSSNYVDMFYSLEDFENIGNETVVLYKKSEEYESQEEDIKRETASLDQPFSMLLIGVDSSNDGVTSGYNADVLLLVTFNPNTLKATITSVPRDMYLKTACSGGKYRRINTTTWGSSSSCAVQTIERLFGVNIDYYAKINFKGAVQLVESVGGIDVDVPYTFCDQNSSRAWDEATVYVQKGRQHLNGEQALALARNRHKPNDGSYAGRSMAEFCPNDGDGLRNDYTRGKNQMKVILGIVNSATKISDPDKIVEILENVNRNFQTNITSKDLLTLYDLAKSLVISDNSNIVNVQRMQLSGYSAHIYEESSRSYPSVTIPYSGSIRDIKAEINANLNNTKLEAIKSISFDLNSPYEDSLIGQGRYGDSRISTLKDVSSYSVSSIKSYASSTGLSLSFVDADNGQTVNINDFSDYSFYSQKEHPDIILDQISSLTIYVKKNSSTTPVSSTDETNSTSTDNTNTNTADNNTGTNTNTTTDNNTGTGDNTNTNTNTNNEQNNTSGDNNSNNNNNNTGGNNTTPEPTPDPPTPPSNNDNTGGNDNNE